MVELCWAALQSWGKITVTPSRGWQNISLPVGDSPHGAGGCTGWVQLRLRAAQKSSDLLGSLFCVRMVPCAAESAPYRPTGAACSAPCRDGHFCHPSSTEEGLHWRGMCSSWPKTWTFQLEDKKIQRNKIVGGSELFCVAYRCEDKCFHWK